MVRRLAVALTLLLVGCSPAITSEDLNFDKEISALQFQLRMLLDDYREVLEINRHYRGGLLECEEVMHADEAWQVDDN